MPSFSSGSSFVKRKNSWIFCGRKTPTRRRAEDDSVQPRANETGPLRRMSQSQRKVSYKFSLCCPIGLDCIIPPHSFHITMSRSASLRRCISVSMFLLLVGGLTNASADLKDSNFDGCDEVFVGAGWAGVYSFYRRILDNPTRGPKACLFEESWRIGGRTYSVSINHTTPNFVQDIGAYRFSPDMHLPGDLILKDLRLPTECYASECPFSTEEMPDNFPFNYTAPMRRIIDADTKLPTGYVTPIHRMVEIAKGFGGRVFTQTPLVGWSMATTAANNPVASLVFQDQVTNQTIVLHSPSVVILNLPRNKLFEIQGMEASLDLDMVKTLKCIAFDRPTDMFGDAGDSPNSEVQVTTFEKAYLYYSDAWWRTLLHKTEGFFPAEEFLATPTKEGVLFNLRFHDGPVSCSDVNEKECNGLLQIYYSVSNETVYSSLVDDHPGEPLGMIWDTNGAEAVEKLNMIHKSLMGLLSPLFEDIGIDDPSESVGPPSGLIVGVWTRPSSHHPLGLGYTAPTKVYYEPSMSGTPDEVCGVPDLTEMIYRDTVLEPWGENAGDGTSVFLMNNDWVCMNVRYFFGDWAEESLLQAERAMYLLNTPRPTWLDESYYREKVMWQVRDRNDVTMSSQFRGFKLYGIVGLTMMILLVGLLRRKRDSRRKDYTAL